VILNQGEDTTFEEDLARDVLEIIMAVSSTVSACGEEGSGSGRKTGVKPASVKQEAGFVYV